MGVIGKQKSYSRLFSFFNNTTTCTTRTKSQHFYIPDGVINEGVFLKFISKRFIVGKVGTNSKLTNIYHSSFEKIFPNKHTLKL